ncbi:hypothetical protein F4W66_24710 (plasmid) [Escherichia coli]|nr:hypothetical protein F4W66_24710 [Escherichia coli]
MVTLDCLLVVPVLVRTYVSWKPTCPPAFRVISCQHTCNCAMIHLRAAFEQYPALPGITSSW